MEQVGRYQLHVRFMNTAPETISRVTFALNDGSRIKDAGKFSPNVTIDHWINLNNTNATSCSVSSIKLADGSRISVAKK